MSVAEWLAWVTALGWLGLRLCSIAWAAKTLPSVVAECRSSAAIATTWVVFVGSMLMVAHTELGSRELWNRLVWWALTVVSGLLAVFGPELREWLQARRERS